MIAGHELDLSFDLVRLALALGAQTVGGAFSDAEQVCVTESLCRAEPSAEQVDEFRSAILSGADPLGELFLEGRKAETRRANGAVYTPSELVQPMVEWVAEQSPARIVDPGAGSGRFLLAALALAPSAEAIAIDVDPVATLMARANLAVRGHVSAVVLNTDYRAVKLPEIDGRTAYVGNPPYVRHHGIEMDAKAAAKDIATSLGHQISGLAGLHTHFFLYTAALARAGDVGCFVTSSEWLDVNYGEIVRKLFLGQLGGESIHVVEPRALPFEGTQTTATIVTFKVGATPDPLRFQDVSDLKELRPLSGVGRSLNRQRLMDTKRWSGILRVPRRIPEGLVELGEICRVHRGAVTGANATWVRRHGADLPTEVLFPSVTRARELFAAGDVLRSTSALKLVVDIPADLDELGAAERRVVQQFIADAKRAGVDKGYIAAHRRAWWAVGLKAPAPILATYMARRAPTFVVNEVGARHINIAHGLYPRERLPSVVIHRLAEALRSGVQLSDGRVYAGGLTKFEPREMERLLVPDMAILRSHERFKAGLDT